jgi:hypothetical protein
MKVWYFKITLVTISYEILLLRYLNEGNEIMMKYLSILILPFVFVLTAKSQDGIPGKVNASFVQVRNDDAHLKGPVKRPCLLWLPPTYNDSSNTPFFPLLVFLYGSKKSTSLNEVSLRQLKENGPFHFLQTKKWNGSADYGGQCGQKHFIVFAMQAGNGTGSDAKETGYAISQLLLRFRIDASRIIIAGINEGAGTLLHYLADTSLANRPRLIIPMSVPILYNSQSLAIAAKKGIKAWAFTFDKDIKGQAHFKTNTINLVNGFNAIIPNSAKLTIKSGTNCCWNKYFDPAFRQEDTGDTAPPLNIYEWIMKNISWGDPRPPIYACEEFIITPYKLAGYISAGKKSQRELNTIICSIPVYTITGKITIGTVVYLERSGDNILGGKLHYGFSNKKLKGASANSYLIIDDAGRVISNQ